MGLSEPITGIPDLPVPSSLIVVGLSCSFGQFCAPFEKTRHSLSSYWSRSSTVKTHITEAFHVQSENPRGPHSPHLPGSPERTRSHDHVGQPGFGTRASRKPRQQPNRQKGARQS